MIVDYYSHHGHEGQDREPEREGRPVGAVELPPSAALFVCLSLSLSLFIIILLSVICCLIICCLCFSLFVDIFNIVYTSRCVRVMIAQGPCYGRFSEISSCFCWAETLAH